AMMWNGTTTATLWLFIALFTTSACSTPKNRNVRSRPAPCPNCQAELDWDEVDIGVGVQTGPAYCPSCGYQEDFPWALDDERGYPPDSQRTNEFIREPAPVVEAPDELRHVDALAKAFHEALHPAEETPNIGLATIGARQHVIRLLKLVR